LLAVAHKLIAFQGEVVTGFGRGSREMGVATANVAPTAVAEQLKSRPLGVYFGWAQVLRRSGKHSEVVRMVMNYGERPTIKDGSNITVLDQPLLANVRWCHPEA
jgi:riboflavin kinase